MVRYIKLMGIVTFTTLSFHKELIMLSLSKNGKQKQPKQLPIASTP